MDANTDCTDTLPTDTAPAVTAGIDPDLLATRLTAAITRGGSGGDVAGRLWPVLLRELARGRPVTFDD